MEEIDRQFMDAVKKYLDVVKQYAAINVTIDEAKKKHRMMMADVAVDEARAKVKSCIKSGADVNAVDEHGNTALMLTALTDISCYFLFGWLLFHGADVNARNKDNKTALFIARGNGLAWMVQILKENGAIE